MCIHLIFLQYWGLSIDQNSVSVTNSWFKAFYFLLKSSVKRSISETMLSLNCITGISHTASTVTGKQWLLQMLVSSCSEAAVSNNCRLAVMPGPVQCVINVIANSQSDLVWYSRGELLSWLLEMLSGANPCGEPESQSITFTAAWRHGWTLSSNNHGLQLVKTKVKAL